MTASMPTVPAYLQRRAKALYLAGLDELREGYLERARSEGRKVSDAELKDLHYQARGSALNTLSRRGRRL